MIPYSIGHGSDESGGSNSGELLLRDIEAISKALYLDKTPSKDLDSSSNVVSNLSGKTRLTDAGSNSKPGVFEGDLLRKDKKSSIWNWKPLKALTHMRTRRFNCCFFLHIHSVQGLPPSFNDLNLRVHWKRKEAVHTCPSKVYHGVADFEETLMHRSTVYGSRNRPRQTAEYEAKHFEVYPSVVEAPGLDIGRHWIDLTKLLPLTFEELEEDKSLGKWNTSFKLSGKAKGAEIHVSFGYLLVGYDLDRFTRKASVPELLKLSESRLRLLRSAGRLRANDSSASLNRVESIRSILKQQFHISSRSMDVKHLQKSVPEAGLNLTTSIYGNVDEAKMDTTAKLDVLCENVESLESNSNLFSESPQDFKNVCNDILNDCDDVEFTIIEQGIEVETPKTGQLELVEGSGQIYNEAVEVDEIAGGKKNSLNQKSDFADGIDENCENEFVLDGLEYVEAEEYVDESVMEEQGSTYLGPSVMALEEKEIPAGKTDFLEQMQSMYIEPEASQVLRSFSFDDIDSVASDFLKLLEIEHMEPESPRERLLRQFEKELSASGNFNFDFDGQEETPEIDTATARPLKWNTFSQDFNFSPAIQAAESENKSLRSKRTTFALKDLDLKCLQNRELKDEAVRSPPHFSSGGFGSPIPLPPGEPLEFPLVKEGLGPTFQIKSGGFLRPMSPLLQDAEIGRALVLQVSRPVVLPAELGFDIMEILQHLALVGIEELSEQMNKMMPLEDITGKNLQQLAWENPSSRELSMRHAELHLKSKVGKRLFGKKDFEWFTSQAYDSQNSDSLDGETVADCVSLVDLIPLAMDIIEALSVEGLKIQTGKSAKEAPSCIKPNFSGPNLSTQEFTLDEKETDPGSPSSGDASSLHKFDSVVGEVDANGLLCLSLKLDDWIKLDAGIVNDENKLEKRNILVVDAARQAEYTELGSEELTKNISCGHVDGESYGLLGNILMVALMVQLRDPSQNYEPIGNPMFTIIRADRVFTPPERNICNSIAQSSLEDKGFQSEYMEMGMRDGRKQDQYSQNGIHQCRVKLTEVHLAGLKNTEPNKQIRSTTTQQQAGSRGLLAGSMLRNDSHSFLSSKKLLWYDPQAIKTMQTRDILWSISSAFHETDTDGLAAVNLHMRNPDIIFPSTSIAS